MMLQLLISQYNESETVIRPMLDSIAAQQDIDFDDIEVLVGNDGSDVLLSRDFVAQYEFPLRYLRFDHGGLQYNRAKLFDAATADYVMWCDADDSFYSLYGLRTILDHINRGGFDAFISDFLEGLAPEPGSPQVYQQHTYDGIFVHGKAYRRQYLVDNGIVWHPELTRHADSCFNALAIALSQKTVYCKEPLYLWRWREGSICRGKFDAPLTYVLFIESNERLIRDFMERGRRDDAAAYANMLLINAFFLVHSPEWDAAPGHCIPRTESRLTRYIRDHLELIESIEAAKKRSIYDDVRRRMANKGIVVDESLFAPWVEHLMEG